MSAKHRVLCECGQSYQLDSMPESAHVCSCGKECWIDFRSEFEINHSSFDPYYDPVLRSVVTSLADQEKKMKEHKSYSHPQGLVAIQDDKKFLKECRDIRANRLDYMRQQYGDNYVKHQMETNPAFRAKCAGRSESRSR